MGVVAGCAFNFISVTGVVKPNFVRIRVAIAITVEKSHAVGDFYTGFVEIYPGSKSVGELYAHGVIIAQISTQHEGAIRINGSLHLVVTKSTRAIYVSLGELGAKSEMHGSGGKSGRILRPAVQEGGVGRSC